MLRGFGRWSQGAAGRFPAAGRVWLVAPTRPEPHIGTAPRPARGAARCQDRKPVTTESRSRPIGRQVRKAVRTESKGRPPWRAPLTHPQAASLARVASSSRITDASATPGTSS
ncbi:hypothetical protein GCM10023097_02440 [Streptomyces collinus]